MSETVLFDEEGVKIMPGTMTVENGLFWSSSNKEAIEPLKIFPLNGVTEIRCVTIHSSPLSELWRRMGDRKRHIIYGFALFVALVMWLLSPGLISVGKVEFGKLLIDVSVLIVILSVTLLVFDTFCRFVHDVLFDEMRGAAWGTIILVFVVGFFLSKLDKKNAVLQVTGFIVLSLAVLVYCIIENAKQVRVRSRVSLIRDHKEVVCYERDLYSGAYSYENPAWEKEYLNTMREGRKSEEVRIKRITEALGAAIGQR